MLKITNVKIKIHTNEEDYAKVIAQNLNVRAKTIQNVELIKRSIDARHHLPHYICAFAFDYSGDQNKLLKQAKNQVTLYQPSLYTLPMATKQKQVVVVGSGPAGLFCALSLAYQGLKPILIERGKCVEKRKKDIQTFWQEGILDVNSNVQFGEGGAGTFSDGKLTTNIKDVRKDYILKEFVKAGAPKEILYEAKAHIGTDYLEIVVKNMRETILSLGGQVLFETTFVGFDQEEGKVKAVHLLKDGKVAKMYCDALVLAIGHSSRDTYRLLYDQGLQMARKPFSVGVRVEHLQKFIDSNQYGRDDLDLKAADYKLAYHTKKEHRGVYTFCMCPGGQVVASSSQKEGVVTNGMSEFARDKANANSAVLVSLNPEDFAGDDVFAGMKFQIELEKKAFELGGKDYKAPCQLVEDFINKQASFSCKEVEPTYLPGVRYTNLWDLFPSFISEALQEGLLAFDKKIKGFASNGAIMTAVESRSSSPVRICRDDLMQANIKNIYPIGEGAGAAGGIMTSAIDGIKCAESILQDK